MSDTSPGLSQLREQKGISIEQLAAAIRVSPIKILALEEGRYADLPNAGFARALAISVCRQLKVDPAAILARLPAPDPINLINDISHQPVFNSGRAKHDWGFLEGARQFFKLKYLVPFFILVAAGFVYFWPYQTQAPVQQIPEVNSAPLKVGSPDKPDIQASLQKEKSAPDPLTPINGDSNPIANVTSQSLPVASVPAVASSSGVVNGADIGYLTLKASEEVWVQIKDAAGKSLLRGTVLAGEEVTISGALPFKAKIGKAATTSLIYQGMTIDLKEHTRANVAKLEIK